MTLLAAWRPIGICVLLVVAFFVVPISSADNLSIWRTGATVMCLGLAVWLIARQIRRQVDEPASPLAGLILAIVSGVLIFAMIDYTVAVKFPGQFASLATRVDALYFTLTTLATVGYGDVHAVGQFARGLLCAQLVFNIVVIGAAASVVANQVRARARAPKP